MSAWRHLRPSFVLPHRYCYPSNCATPNCAPFGPLGSNAMSRRAAHLLGPLLGCGRPNVRNPTPDTPMSGSPSNLGHGSALQSSLRFQIPMRRAVESPNGVQEVFTHQPPFQTENWPRFASLMSKGVFCVLKRFSKGRTGPCLCSHIPQVLKRVREPLRGLKRHLCFLVCFHALSYAFTMFSHAFKYFLPPMTYMLTFALQT